MEDKGQEALRIARNLIRVGEVNSVNEEKGTVRVLFKDKDNVITDDLPVLECARIPLVGDEVVCIFLGNGLSGGFCLGRFYSNNNPPSN